MVPHLVPRYRLFAHRFAASCVDMPRGEPYWRDVGTLDAYWGSQHGLAKVTPVSPCTTATGRWTYQEQLPPAKFVFDSDGRRGVADSMVSGGCIVSGATVRRSVLFSMCACTTARRGGLRGAARRRRPRLRRAIVDRQVQLDAKLSTSRPS